MSRCAHDYVGAPSAGSNALVRDSSGVESQNVSLLMSLKSVPTAFGRIGGRHVELKIRRSRRASSQAENPERATVVMTCVGYDLRTLLFMTVAVGTRDMA